nr:choice-of-anchor D domain-containing protein [Candidatus Krumholzibacteria bacterium]
MSRLNSPIPFVVALMIALAGLATPGTALAQAQVGIYFDTDYTQNTLEISDFPAQVTGYLVLHNPEGGYPVHGWECCVDVSGPLTFLGWELEGLTINVLEPPCFTVGIGGDPLPGTGDVLLATFQGLVTEAMPILFNLEPVYYASIPDEMVYLGGGDGHTLLPMVTPTGLPQVASINEDLPFPELSAEELIFGERPIGTTTIRNLVVSNIGGGMLYLDVTLPPEVTDYTIVNNAGEVWIPVGESRTITVYFEPTVVGPINTVLDLGPVAPAVPLYGSGREAIVTYTGPDSVDFGDSALGTTVTRTANFTNTGEIPIIVAPSLPAGCDGFAVLNPDPFELLVGLTTTVHLSFTSPYPGDFECTLDMGDVIAPLTLTAQAHEAVVAYTVTPEALFFGPLAEGSSQQLPVLIENTGEAGFAVEPQVVDPLGNFQIGGIVGDTQVQPGNTLTISVLFEPMGTGVFTGELQLGDVVSPVYLEGQAEAANPQCEVTPTLLEFPTIGVGSATQSYFTVQNTGNVPLTVTPYEDCDHFYVAPFPVNL